MNKISQLKIFWKPPYSGTMWHDYRVGFDETGFLSSPAAEGEKLVRGLPSTVNPPLT